jgi:hypothetical protein
MGKIIKRGAGIDVGKRFLFCDATLKALLTKNRTVRPSVSISMPQRRLLERFTRLAVDGTSDPRGHGEHGFRLDPNFQHFRG